MMPHDGPLKDSDIQSLSSRRAIMASFTQLGYGTESYLVQTPATMGFTGEGPIRDIGYIERIAGLLTKARV